MSFFITLVEQSDDSRRAIENAPRVKSMMHKGLTLAEYKAFLHDLYHIVLHFCPIMAVAEARCEVGLLLGFRERARPPQRQQLGQILERVDRRARHRCLCLAGGLAHAS